MCNVHAPVHAWACMYVCECVCVHARTRVCMCAGPEVALEGIVLWVLSTLFTEAGSLSGLELAECTDWPVIPTSTGDYRCILPHLAVLYGSWEWP